MGALRHRDFRVLWGGQAVSAVGDKMNVVAIAVLALERGYGASGLGLLLAVRFGALLAFLVLGGMIADRLPRRRVMLAADVLRGTGVLALVAIPVGAPLLGVAALSFVIGTGEALFRPAYQAVLPSLVPADDLVSANSLSSIALQVSSVLGPVLAGVLIALGSVRLALAVDAVTFLVSAATLLVVAEPRRAERVAQSMARDVAEGFRAVLDRPWIAAVIALAMLHVLFVLGPWQVLLPVVARADLGGDSAYAFLLAAFATGALAGAVVASRLRLRQPGVIALCGLLPWVVLPLTLVVPAPLWVVAGTSAVAGAGEQVFGVLWATAVQRDVPDDLLARVFSLDYLGSFAFFPIGLAAAGPVSDALGMETVMIVASVVTLITTLPLLAMASVRRMASAAPTTVPG